MSSAEQQRISGISVDVDHNQYLAEGAGTVDAIVSIAAPHDISATSPPPERVEAIVIDCSTSMLAPQGKFDEAKRATAAAVDEIADGTYFTVLAGTDKALPVYPAEGAPTRANASSRAAAVRAVDGLRPNGGTALGTWLAYVRAVVGQHPGALTHAILLTDGKDEHTRTARGGNRPQRRRIHVRLPGSGDRLAGRRTAGDLLGAAGHGGYRCRSRRPRG